jgi:hypothetical protein
VACSKTKRPSIALKNGELLARSFKTDGSISAPTKKTIRKMAEKKNFTIFVQLELFLSTKNMREICGELPTDQDVSERGIGGRR